MIMTACCIVISKYVATENFISCVGTDGSLTAQNLEDMEDAAET